MGSEFELGSSSSSSSSLSTDAAAAAAAGVGAVGGWKIFFFCPGTLTLTLSGTAETRTLLLTFLSPTKSS